MSRFKQFKKIDKEVINYKEPIFSSLVSADEYKFHIPLPKEVEFTENELLEREQLIRDLFNLKFDITQTEKIGKIIQEFITIADKELETVKWVDIDYSYTSEKLVPVGDIHGNVFDLKRILNIEGEVNYTELKNIYLFLGDLIDRGGYSFETCLIVLLLKIHNPKKVYIVKGNHENSFQKSESEFKESKFMNEILNRIIIQIEKPTVIPISDIRVSKIAKTFYSLETKDIRKRISITHSAGFHFLRDKYIRERIYKDTVNLFKTAFRYLNYCIVLTLKYEVGFDEELRRIFLVHGGIPLISGDLIKISNAVTKNALKVYNDTITVYLGPLFKSKNFLTDEQNKEIKEVLRGFTWYDVNKKDDFKQTVRKSLGPEIIEEFLTLNGINLMIRGHQPKKTIYKISQISKAEGLLGYRIHEHHSKKVLTIHSNSRFFLDRRKFRYGSFVEIDSCGFLQIILFN